MATVQHTISVNVPVQTVYRHLTQFQEYPRFMEDVESVWQTDEAHLHWTTRMANRPIEWDAEITDHDQDHCIAWHNISGPTNEGKVEMQPIGPDVSQITFTLRTEPQQVPGAMSGYSEEDLALRLQQDLIRLKDMIESEAQLRQGQSGSLNTAMHRQPAHSTQGSHNASSLHMRHLGQMPQDTTDEAHGSIPTSDSMGKSSYTLLHEEPGIIDENSGSVVTQAHNNPASQPGGMPTGQPAMPDNASAAITGAHGGTDAAAGAQLSGSQGPGGTSLRKEVDAAGVPGTPEGAMQGDAATLSAGVDAVGGTGIGSSATADDTRTGTGTTSGSGTALTGGGMSGAQDAATRKQ